MPITPKEKRFRLLEDMDGRHRNEECVSHWIDSETHSEDEYDLIALKFRNYKDPFFALVSDTITQYFHHLFGKRFEVVIRSKPSLNNPAIVTASLQKSKETENAPYLANVVCYSDDTILRFTRLVFIVLASLLPILAAIILHQKSARLSTSPTSALISSVGASPPISLSNKPFNLGNGGM